MSLELDPVVTLDPKEMQIAAMVGTLRCLFAGATSLGEAYGASRDVRWQIAIEGACGEMAVAKWAGVYWNGTVGELFADDVANLQVRTTSRGDGSLILHPKDADDKAFILAIGFAPSFVLRGWIMARDGKREEFWRDPHGGRPAFFVPQHKLRPMEDLKVNI